VCTARDAPQTLVDVELRQRRMIVRPGSQIGWPVGRWQRKHGVASTRGKGAHQQQEDVLEGVR